ncbi:M15 family metallopeptidase [Microbacterium sp. 179-I 3D4 NHS]|uniref:M15 family metallopeptidase n=1 Tax=Microbacterium sp. 179-I 3D4 NHS TaxID=3142381 RepID=UPI00399FB958
MNRTTSPFPSRARRLVWTLAGLTAAVIAAFAVQQSLAAASVLSAGGAVDAPSETSVGTTVDHPATIPPGGSVIAPSEADGVIRDGDQPTVFDTDRVAVGNLEPALLDALQRAARDADDAGVTLLVNSGWRSAALQTHLLQEAVVGYGSAEEAERWVATPETSLHVSGEAVDLGPLPSLDWLAQHGAAYGLCQIYANEPWHYELRPDAAAEGCPEMYADPTADPRMQR